MAGFENDTFVTANTDDLLIDRSACNKDMIVASLPTEVDKVVVWFDKARLTPKSSKFETTFLSQHWSEAVWQTNVIVRNRMFCNPFPSVSYDRQLTFWENVGKLCQSISIRVKLLRALGGTTWGWHTSYLHQVFIVIVHSMIEYATVAWETWLSSSNTSKLEKVQLEEARAITGLVRFTPVEASQAESKLPPILTCYKNHLHPMRWRVGPSSTSGRSSSNLLRRKQTAHEEEWLAQRSITPSEWTRSQFPGGISNHPLL